MSEPNFRKRFYRSIVALSITLLVPASYWQWNRVQLINQIEKYNPVKVERRIEEVRNELQAIANDNGRLSREIEKARGK